MTSRHLLRISLLSVSFGGAVLGGLASGGCSKFREQMPAARLNKQHVATDHGPVVFAPDVDQDHPNTQNMDGLPAGVQATFRAEHPSAGITSIQQVPSRTGLMLYRVAYLEDGVAGSTLYRASGRDLATENAPVIIRPRDTERPRATYAPATKPAESTTATEIMVKDAAH